MHQLVSKIEERAIVHDLSKFEEDEFAGFEELDSDEVFKLYGTKEYKDIINKNKGIELHYSRNSHHPEHYEDVAKGFTHFNGIDGMSFLDIVEMVIDWKSASETYGNDFMESIDYSIDRFNADDKQAWLIKMIAEEIK